ncbi:hypothetical protein IFM89_001702, partial [Coptis chinensis]
MDVENFYLSQSYQSSGDQDKEIDRRSHGSDGFLEAKGSLDALNLLNDSNRFSDTLRVDLQLKLGGLSQDKRQNLRILLSQDKWQVKRCDGFSIISMMGYSQAPDELTYGVDMKRIRLAGACVLVVYLLVIYGAYVPDWHFSVYNTKSPDYGKTYFK